MALRDDIDQLIEECGIVDVDPAVLNERLKSRIVSSIAQKASFLCANRDAITNIKALDLSRDPDDLIDELREFADRDFVDEEAEEIGMPRSFYHSLQILLAGLEGVTGFPLCEPYAYSVAYDHYWETTAAILKAVQFHRQARESDD